MTAPQALVADLHALFGRAASVPSHVDEAIVGLARRQITRRRTLVRVVRWAGAAAAAAVLAIAALWPRGAAREDIDRNGRVDILDAFTLARHLVADRAVRPEWDQNGDGVVDAADVDDVAMSAVRLDRGSLQ